MRELLSFIKKEYIEALRTGKLIVLVLVFLLFGVMSPAIAKLTPFLMETLSDTMAQSGIIVSNVQVDAMTSWAQFFKNIPIALIAFVLMFSDTFTKEYKSGTLLLLLTKGLSRYKVILAKTVLLLSLWSLGCGLCFAVTYGYNAYFWDNSIMNNLFFSAFIWWLFGVWVICLVVVFSTLLSNNTGVTFCVGATVIFAYIIRLVPKIKAFSPAVLMNTGTLLDGTEETGAFLQAVFSAAVLSIAGIAVSIPLFNSKRL